MALLKSEDRKATAKAIYSLAALDRIPSEKIERELRKIDGITSTSVNYVTGTISIEYDPHALTPEEIRMRVKDLSH